MNPKLESVLDKIIAKMETGNMNWRKTWNAQMPCNYQTKRVYSGINLLNTMFSQFTSPYYLTFKQVQELGGNVKKGSKGTEIVFWQPTSYTTTNSEGSQEEKNGLIFRLYYVFNAEQIEGIDFVYDEPNREMQSVQFYQDLVCDMASESKLVHLTLKHGGSGAYYSPAIDNITMPNQRAFENDGAYLQTLFHEAVHATGHKSRLDRLSNSDQFDRSGESYSVEELTAELGACFIMNHFGIENDLDNSAAYCKGWATRIKENKSMLQKAASQASKAMNWILQEAEVVA